MQNFVIDIVVASNIHHNLSNKIFKCKTMDSHCTSLCKVHLFIHALLLVLNINCKINSLFAAQTVTNFTDLLNSTWFFFDSFEKSTKKSVQSEFKINHFKWQADWILFNWISVYSLFMKRPEQWKLVGYFIMVFIAKIVISSTFPYM